MSKGFQIIGEKEVQRLFKRLPDKAKGRAIKSIARGAAKPIVKAARALVPSQSGDTKRSIKVHSVRSKDKSFTSVMVGIKPGRSNGFYAHHNVNPKTDRGGRGRIQTPHKDYIKEAGGMVGKEVLTAMGRQTIKVLEREIKKLKR